MNIKTRRLTMIACVALMATLWIVGGGWLPLRVIASVLAVVGLVASFLPRRRETL